MSDEVRMTKEQFEDLLLAAVEQGIEKAGLTAVDKRNMVTPGMTDEEVDTLSLDEKMKRFFRALWVGDTKVVNELSPRALSEGTATAGGTLVPEEFELEVIRVVEQYGLIPRYARKYDMATDTLNLAGLTSSITAYWPSENSQITHSQPVFAAPSITAYKLAGITSFSNELLADNASGLNTLLVDLFAEALAAEIDNEGLQGDGSSPSITGVLNTSGTATQTLVGQVSFSGIDRENLIEGIRQLTIARRTGGRFVFHRDVIGEIEKLTDANGQPLMRGMYDGDSKRLLGYPLEETEKLPSIAANDGPSRTFGFFGNFNWIHYGVRSGLAVAIGTEGTVNSNNMFENDMAAIRVIQRIGLTVSPANAFVVYQTGAAS